MTISPADIDSFIGLYKEVYKQEINRSQAEEQIKALIILIRMTYQPMTKAEHCKYYKGLKKA
ncbi:MAG: hypothetical protein PHG95_00820 [Patescibacteria group bacterium]|nr:hypothetical protein [Patescibacteria group bacterium]